MACEEKKGDSEKRENVKFEVNSCGKKRGKKGWWREVLVCGLERKNDFRGATSLSLFDFFIIHQY